MKRHSFTKQPGGLAFRPIGPLARRFAEMLVWFGALVAVNLQTAFLSPPVAMSAFYLRNVVPQWGLWTIYRGMADYMVIQILVLIAIIMWPSIALWLPLALR